MNKFEEYVTGQVFALHLSRRMCEALEFICRMDIHVEAYKSIPTIPNLVSIRALEERGLVACGPWHLTDAGKLLYPLLAHAGLVKSRETLEIEVRSSPTIPKSSAVGVAY